MRRSASPSDPSVSRRRRAAPAIFADGSGARTGDCSVAASPPIRDPHFGQKEKSGAQTKPQAAQDCDCRLPQRGQKAKPF
ncbi:hypothetical protein MesoLjLc_04780 [Mesorhizobium sp. L-8-10]|nr:hypothetical protein MesoLjLc_04780 [Mesorhizobium sp. L-8-10]